MEKAECKVMQPLEGLLVVDLTRALAGPYCTMMLADLGAQVIKIEQPLVGDETRGWGPPFLEGTSDSAYYAALNRNKKSLTLDLKMPAAKKILAELIAQADVLVENFRLGTMKKLGFSYEEVSQINSRLVYCSLTGFGSTGPYAERGGYDVIIQGMGGLMSITGEEEGQPMRVGVPIVDITTGMFGTQGVLAALYAREKTGKGQFVETSLLESQIAWLTNVGSNYLISGKVPKRLGNMHPNITPYQPYKASDGYVIVAVGNDKLWKSFTEALGVPELSDDARFVTNALRNQNRTELNQILGKLFSQKTASEWTELMVVKGIPSGPINTMDKVFSDPQVLARDMLIQVKHPVAGEIKMAGLPIKFSQTPAKIKSHPPLLGEHTEEILEKLGYSLEDIHKLRENSVV